jgi:catechol 2,3-dioxygenase-like lactoylglutathione lyase family enzyme
MLNLTSQTLRTMSSRAKRGICFLILLGTFGCPVTNAQAQRPKIFGIAWVQISVTDYCKSIDFYAGVFGRTRHSHTDCPPPNQVEKFLGTTIPLHSGQDLSLGSHGTPDPHKVVNNFGFFIDDASVLLQYLKSQGVEANYADRYGARVTAQDPEGHGITFIEHKQTSKQDQPPMLTGEPRRILHLGFIVWNQTAMEHFYKDILGFHIYWHGGMKDDQTDWVDMQVPDGTDWVEFMLNVPTDAEKQTIGVMNHIALGVPDIHAAQQQLLKNGWKGTEQPQIGRDGKWQLNLYDPDGTRVELMEFTPVEKPCCSEYTGPHPKP